MCYPQEARCEAPSTVDSKRKSTSSRVVQALREFRSPLQLRKTLKRNCSNLGITSANLRSVTGKASARVVVVTRWVFNLNFAKIFVPFLVFGFLALLHPHTEIQIGVLAGILLFIFAFLFTTRDTASKELLTGKSLLEVEVIEDKENIQESKSTECEIITPPSLLFLIYQSLPLPFISIIWGIITSIQFPYPVSTFTIWLYAKLTGCDISEAEEDIFIYKTVSHFFTRRLKPGLRPISDSSPLVSPADGRLTYAGVVFGVNVKGVRYSIPTFLGFIPASTNPSMVLHHAVVYLSPCDYHRFHSPAAWQVTSRRHFPGSLCSVSPKVESTFPGLLHTNERVVFEGSWHYGFFAMAAVGATSVGSVVVDFDADLKTNTRVNNQYQHEVTYKEPIQFEKGDDFGYFNFGSTIVMIFEAPEDTIVEEMVGNKIKMGEALLR